MEENKFTGYMKKEEIRRQKTFGLKKAVDVSVYREDGLKDTQNTWYKQECSWVLKIKEWKIQSSTGQTQIIVGNFQCAWSASNKGRNSSAIRNKCAHNHYGFLLQKLFFSSGLWERFTCSPLMVWREVVSGIFSRARISDRYIHKNGSHTQ